MKNTSQKIIPCLWFDSNGEEAVKFYTSIFQNSNIFSTIRYPGAGKEFHNKETGSVMTIDFTLENYRMLALNGGPDFQFNSAISFFFLSDQIKDIKRVWDRLLEGGNSMMELDTYDWSSKYGWLKDRFGVNWQVMFEEKRSTQDTIVPMIFFTGERQGKAEEAISKYISIFQNSSIQGILHYGEDNSFANGHIMHAQFYLENQTFMAMDSGMKNNYPFTEAISFMVLCDDQKEIDYYWYKLAEGGDIAAQQCGWLKDKFGVSWQVVPDGMNAMLSNPEKANQIMEAFLRMKKIDLEVLTKVAKR